jgi:phosphoadenosine phosphosulfate reductase
MSVDEAMITAAATLDRMLADADPATVIREACRAVGRAHVAAVSSFGTESAVLLKYVADVDPSLPVLFLDTGWLYEETLAYRDQITARLGLRDVRSIAPAPARLAARDPGRDLWFSDPDACCALRKVEPLAEALAPFDAWINGRKRYHGGERSKLQVVEADGLRLKFNPLARLSPAEIAAVFRAAGLPPHPLAALGFPSIGCMPCTSRAEPDEDIRSGRWRGRAKTECGIHSAVAKAPQQPAVPADVGA